MRYLLVLSDMRAEKIENSDRPIAWAHTPEPLNALMERERVKPYGDDVDGRRWAKAFRKGGPLEWYNDGRGMFGQPKIVEVNGPEDAAATALRGAETFFREIPMEGPRSADVPGIYPAALAPAPDLLESALHAYAAMWKSAATNVIDGEEAAWIHTGQPADVWDALRARGIAPEIPASPQGDASDTGHVELIAAIQGGIAKRQRAVLFIGLDDETGKLSLCASVDGKTVLTYVEGEIRIGRTLRLLGDAIERTPAG